MVQLRVEHLRADNSANGQNRVGTVHGSIQNINPGGKRSMQVQSAHSTNKKSKWSAFIISLMRGLTLFSGFIFLNTALSVSQKLFKKFILHCEFYISYD